LIDIVTLANIKSRINRSNERLNTDYIALEISKNNKVPEKIKFSKGLNGKLM